MAEPAALPLSDSKSPKQCAGGGGRLTGNNSGRAVPAASLGAASLFFGRPFSSSNSTRFWCFRCRNRFREHQRIMELQTSGVITLSVAADALASVRAQVTVIQAQRQLPTRPPPTPHG